MTVTADPKFYRRSKVNTYWSPLNPVPVAAKRHLKKHVCGKSIFFSKNRKVTNHLEDVHSDSRITLPQREIDLRTTGYEAVSPVMPCPPPLPRRPVTIGTELSRLHSEPTHVTNKLTLP
jgi:hypothetical protein